MTGRLRAALLMVCTLLSTQVIGQEETYPAIDVPTAKAPELPARTLKFEESKEVLDVDLFAADPNLLKQNYVATLVLQRPLIERNDSYVLMGRRTGTDKHENLSVLLWAQLKDSVGRGLGTADLLVADWLKQLEEAAGDQKLDESVLKQLREKHRVRVKLREERGSLGGFSRSSGIIRSGMVPSPLTLYIFGPDAQTTKAMAIAILKMHDQGISKPLQLRVIKEINDRKAALPKELAKLKEDDKKANGIAEKLKGLEAIPTEVIADLNTKKRLLSVDIAGAQARIAACEALMKNNKIRSQKNAEHVESIKITAEIELVGLTAQLELLGNMIDSGNQRRKIQSSLSRAQSTVRRGRERIENEVRLIEKLEASRKRFLPITVKEDMIRIQPIKWHSAGSQQ